MISQELADFVINLEFAEIPTQVVEKAKLYFLDIFGIMMGVCEFEQVKPIRKLAHALGGPPESTIVGETERVSAPNAVLANATVAHSVDFDDTHLGSGIHLSASIVPTALAVGERTKASGEELLSSVVAAYEIGARLGLAAPFKFQDRGFHPTSVIGVFTATAVSGKLLNLNSAQLRGAFGFAGSMASGILESVHDGTWVKPFHPAWASHAGIIASLMAKEGYSGPPKIFEGEWGLYNTYLKGEKVNLDAVIKGLGNSWETTNIAMKPYPACHVTHSAIDATIQNRRDHNLSPSDVKQITCYAPKLSFELVCEPYEEKVKPSTPYSAKFSMFYIVSVALKRGYVGIWDFTTESIRDKDTLNMCSKVKCILDESYDKRYRGEGVVPVRMVIETVGGDRYETEVVHHKGTPHNPLTREDVIAKFRSNLERSTFAPMADETIRRVLNLEKERASNLAGMLGSIATAIPKAPIN